MTGRTPGGDAAGAPGDDPVPDRIHARPVPRPGRWVSAVVLLVLAAMAVNALLTNEKFRWDVVWLYFRDVTVVRGVGWTLVLTFGSMLIAIVLAVLLAIMRRSDNPVMKAVSWGYIWFFRGTPIYTQLVFWGLISVLYPRLSLGIPFGPEFFEFRTADLFTAFVCALIGLSLNEAAYLAEIVRAGLGSVDPGQTEAAKALGMKDGKILTRIVLPQAMRVIVPPTGNETISMLKTTSLVLAVPFTLDLQYSTNAIGNRLFLPIPLLMVAAIWYLLITSVLMVGQHYVERYYGRGFGTQTSGGRRGRGPGGRGRRPRKQDLIAASGTTKDDPFLEVTP
ncbi:amino acid ABC transporter permease [Cellulosimicrobium composti]|uniref:Amino acid ABC transporter permease n=1 Tax=Cellulosimicrobium composti TaxID=2672572 RepID=A0ABX0BAQ6_9MICO|nr:amino acid ABC transporter permease [Cellulosimicrobium composti]NDO88685.1 amino acid ABC transporter permease [Cellulosimicrobium composti]TWG84302.1 polar amino acid transport system permease protein [Cellulosimicrobium cellulans J34]SMF14951.1 polar amino acid transport system permease protein [Cellulosimicrobium cellulans J1]